MSENNQNIRDDPEKVGIISNYITEQLFSRDYELVTIPYDNFEMFLETTSISLFILDNHIYETDHPWFEKDYNDLMYTLKHRELVVVKNDSTPLLEIFSTCKIFDFNNEYTENLSNRNIIKTPLLVNEMLFNPAYAIKNNDIVFLNRFNKPHDGNIQDLISRKKLNVIDSNMKYLTADTLKELSTDIKRSKFIYIYKSLELNSLILKFIEIISHLQNTTVIYDEHSNNNLTSMGRIKYIEFLYNNPLYLERENIKNSRKAFLNHSLINNSSIEEVLNGNSNDEEIKISVITSTIRKDYINNYIEQLNIQNGVKLEVVLLTHKFEFSNLEKKDLQEKADFDLIIMEGNETESLGQCLNKCLKKVSNNYVTKMDDDDYYTSNYLLDSYIALKFSNASIVGKGSHFVYLEGQNLYVNRLYNNKNKYVSRVIGGSIFCKTSLLKKYNFDDVSSGEDTKLFRRILKDQHLIYANHPYETCLFRSSDKSAHTWQVDEEYIMSGSKVISFGDPSSFIYID